MDLINSFIDLPLFVSIGVGILLFIFIMVGKIRNSTKASFILFPVIGIVIAGLIYTYYNKDLGYLLVTIALAEIILLPYAIVISISDPQKKKEKKFKKTQEGTNKVELSNTLSEDAIKHYEGIIEENSQLTIKTASFFNNEDVLSSFLEHVNKLVTEKTHADGCAILLLDDFDNILEVKSFIGSFPPPYKLPDEIPHKQIRVETNFKFAQFPLIGNIFGTVATEGKAINVVNPAKDNRIFQNGPEDFLKCGPYIFVPLKQEDETIGVVCLSRKAGSEPFTQQEFEDACSLVKAASVSMYPLKSFLAYTEHAELTKEGDIATKFQKTMLPEKMPVINKISIGKYFEPAENVVGDYYDIIPSRKDRISFVMADIAGKGMTSLVIMSMIRAMIRLVANTNQSAATLLEWINKAICSEKNSMDHFASLALINYNSINNTAQIATCGINPVLVYSAKEKQIKKVSFESEPIGVDKLTHYKDIDLTLENGDIIITCTDGLLECLNESGVQYAMDNLYKVIQANCSLSGKDIANKVKDSIKHFCGSTQQYDDQSLLVIKIQG